MRPLFKLLLCLIILFSSLTITTSQAFAWISVQIAPQYIPADGTTTATVNAVIRRSDGGPIGNQNVTFSITYPNPNFGSLVPSSALTNSGGVAQTIYHQPNPPSPSKVWIKATVTLNVNETPQTFSGYGIVYVGVVDVKSQTVATTPSNRERTTIGIGEQVTCWTYPSVSVTWSVTGGGSVSPGSGTSTTFTASKSPSTSTVHAQIGDADFTKNFTAIAPTSITSVKKSDVGLGSIGPPNNKIGAYTTYDITVNSTSVSFFWAQFRENIPTHNWTWPNGTGGGIGAQTPEWSVGYDNKTVDNIKDGPFPIGYIYNGTNYVDFNYIVTWKEEYKNENSIWVEWIASENTNTEYRGADQKCRETHMGAIGGWQGPWQ